MKVSFVCIGIGWSAGTVIFGDLARTSLKSERATIYSVVMSARQFGIVAGMFSNNYYYGIANENNYYYSTSLEIVVRLLNSNNSCTHFQ